MNSLIFAIFYDKQYHMYSMPFLGNHVKNVHEMWPLFTITGVWITVCLPSCEPDASPQMSFFEKAQDFGKSYCF